MGALSFACVVIAIEDWDIPGKFSRASAKDNAEYTARLKEALAEMSAAPKTETLFTWGYHQYFHGDVRRPENSTRSVLTVQSLSAASFVPRTHPQQRRTQKYGITETSLSGKDLASEGEADLATGHFYENGLKLVLEPVGKDMLSPGTDQNPA